MSFAFSFSSLWIDGSSSRESSLSSNKSCNFLWFSTTSFLAYQNYVKIFKISVQNILMDILARVFCEERKAYFQFFANSNKG